MNRTRLRRRIRQQLRFWKKAVWVFIAVGAAAWCLAGTMMPQYMEQLLTRRVTSSPVMAVANMDEGQDTQELLGLEQIKLIDHIRDSGLEREVHMITTFICGTETTQMGQLKAGSIADLLEQHPDWHGRLNVKGELWIERQVEDLSPLCKKQAYMGMNREGQLTLFEGPPKKDKVIRTFFQLDIGTMETNLPEGVYQQLKDGIRVQDLQEYYSVLSTFSDYAIEHTKKVMGQEF